jgi:hypothetical protein
MTGAYQVEVEVEVEVGVGVLLGSSPLTILS